MVVRDRVTPVRRGLVANPARVVSIAAIGWRLCLVSLQPLVKNDEPMTNR